jgi:hypothetical protein
MWPKPSLASLGACVTLLVVGAASCAGYVKRGGELYADGRYVEAAEVFERTEGRLAESSERQRAEYGLYRGLTMLVLGDMSTAHRWLAYAYEVERAAPGALRPNKRALLDRGWFELGQRLRSQPPPGQEPATAVAASEPPPARQPPVRSDEGSGSGGGKAEHKRSLVR